MDSKSNFKDSNEDIASSHYFIKNAQSDFPTLQKSCITDRINIDNLTFSMLSELPEHEMKEVISALSLDEIAEKAIQEWERLVERELNLVTNYSCSDSEHRLVKWPVPAHIKTYDSSASSCSSSPSDLTNSDKVPMEQNTLNGLKEECSVDKTHLSSICFDTFTSSNNVLNKKRFKARKQKVSSKITARTDIMLKPKKCNIECSKLKGDDIELLYDSRESLSIIRLNLSKIEVHNRQFEKKPINGKLLNSTDDLCKLDFFKVLNLKRSETAVDNEPQCLKSLQVFKSKEIIEYFRNPVIPIHRVEALYKLIVLNHEPS